MRKKQLCSNCGNEYKPLYRITDDQIMCQNCCSISIIEDFEVAKKFLDPNQIRERDKFDQKIRNLSNPTEFFLSLFASCLAHCPIQGPQAFARTTPPIL